MAKVVSFLLLLGFTAGNIIKPAVFSPEAKLSVLDVAVGLIWVATVYYLVIWRRFALDTRVRRLLISGGLFFMVGLVSLLWSGWRYGPVAVLVGGLYLLRWMMYSLMFGAVGVWLPDKRQVNRLILGLGLALVTVGVVQYVFLPDTRFLQVGQWDPHYYRVIGAWLDPGFTGMLLVLFLVFLMTHRLLARWPQHLVWVLTYATLLLTYSRSSYLAYAVAVCVLARVKRSGSFLVKTMLILAISIYAVPRWSGGEGVRLERLASIQARIRNWQNSWHIFSDHPVLGVGFNVYRYAQRDYGFLDENNWQTNHAGAGADASLLFVAATTGILGLAVYLWYLRQLISLNDLTVNCTLAALVTHSLFLNSLFYPPIMAWLSLLVLSGSDSRLDQKRPGPGHFLRRGV